MDINKQQHILCVAMNMVVEDKVLTSKLIEGVCFLWLHKTLEKTFLEKGITMKLTELRLSYRNTYDLHQSDIYLYVAQGLTDSPSISKIHLRFSYFVYINE